MPKFEMGQVVTVWMGFTTTGTYQSKDGKKHMIFVDDPQCGTGVFGFEKWDEEKNRFTV